MRGCDMDRLTFDGNFCDISQCRELPCPHGGNCTQRKVWERLKQYEDSGLSPIACEEARKIEDGLSKHDYSIARMVELMQADKAGRVVVLPCKAGDELWTFYNYPDEQVCSFTVTDISTLNGRTMLNTSRCGVIDARDVGKTVFLTREEAVEALEAVKDE